MSTSFLERIHMPHVFTLLTWVILFCSFLTYIVPSGEYERETRQIGTSERTVVKAGTYQSVEKEITATGMVIGAEIEGKATPVSVIGFLRAIPKGMEESADIIFFIFIIGGVFGIFQATGVISAAIQKLMSIFRRSDTLLTIIIMVVLGAGGSLLGMGEEFIPLVPIFILVAREMGYDRIYGLAMVEVAAGVGFAAATTNPFTVSIANNIAELPLNTGMGMRLVFFAVCMSVAIAYVLRYGRRLKANPDSSYLKGETDLEHEHFDFQPTPFTGRHAAIIVICLAIFAFILYAVAALGWWMAEMAGGFFLMGIVSIIVARLPLNEAAKAFTKGMEEMVVAALVVGFARGIVVVLNEGMILDTLIYSAATVLQAFPKAVGAVGMLVFQTTLNFFIPSGSGQAAVTMPLMAPLADLLHISRETAVFAFTCGDGFSNQVIPTSGILMAMLSLAGIPYQSWLRFMIPLFLILMGVATVFLLVAVTVPGVWG